MKILVLVKGRKNKIMEETGRGFKDVKINHDEIVYHVKRAVLK